MQESLTLSNPPASPDAASAAGVASPPSLGQLATQVQALRSVVQSQQAQLQALQQQEQAQPLVGWTTDSPWGMALEGLLLGGVALALGAASMWGFRATPGRAGAGPAPLQAGVPAPPAFADSLLYLADQDETQGEPVAVSARLHDPRYDSRGKVIAQDDEDAELDYYRMALTQQGLSVTAGAGQVDSDRIPLDVEPQAFASHPVDGVPSAFASPPSAADFDQRAAAEEVERVRSYLAQRRADRAKAQGAQPEPESVRRLSEALGPPSAPTQPPSTGVPPPASRPMEWDALVQEAPDASPVLDAQPAVPVTQAEAEVLEHTGLAEGASLLAALSHEEPAAPTTPAETERLNLACSTPHRLAREASESPGLPAPVDHVAADIALDALEPSLPTATVQLQLAMEFRDLGLWDEARERALEVLAQPDESHHAQARALLDELAQTGAAPLRAAQELTDPWATLPAADAGV